MFIRQKADVAWRFLVKVAETQKHAVSFLSVAANIDELKSEALCSFDYLEAAFRLFGLTRLLTIFEECLQQVLHHDLLVLFEQVLMPAVSTLMHDGAQFVSEFINRLRFMRCERASSST